MTARTIVPRERAQRDLEEAVNHYAREAGADIALRLIDEVEDAYQRIAANPGIGSPRYAQELDLPGLRAVGLKGFPYLIFYMEQQDRISIWRLLHAYRDIPAHMREAED